MVENITKCIKFGRLNFDQNLAEEPVMKKLDGFFIMIVSLVFMLTGIYIYVHEKMNYFENDSHLKAQYERKEGVISMQQKLTEIDKVAKAVPRRIASISSEPNDSEFMSEDNIILEESAKQYYTEAKTKCYELNKELDCIKIIENAVTHFPESNWTGETLVLLSEFYYRTKRPAHMKDIVKILKQDFKDNKSIQDKVVLIERHLR